MTSYTDFLGGNPLQPSTVGYRNIVITDDTTYSWPFSNEDNANIVAAFMTVTSTASNPNFILPPANQASNGQPLVFRNIGSNTFTVTDNGSNTIVSVPPGQVYYVYTTDNSTVNGTWASLALGIGTSSLDAASLAGAGLVAIAALLNQSHPVSAKVANYTLTVNDRATTLINTGGSIVFTLPAASTLGNNWFALIKNGGSGTLTITPTSGTIDGNASLVLNQNDACFIICDGTNFWTVGLGQSISIAITRLVKSVAGNTDVTLTTTEAAFTIIEFTGALTGNINVIVPTAVNRWYFYNNTTGSFTLTIKTLAGTGLALSQTTRSIYYCDGTNVVAALTSGGGTLAVTGGGTGLTSVTANALVKGAGTSALVVTGILVGSNNELSGYRANIVARSGTTDTLAGTDTGLTIAYTNASAVTVTLPNSLGVGFACSILQAGAGTVTFSAASGATIHNAHAYTGTAGQWAEMALTVYTNSGGTSAVYILVGDGA